MLIKPVSPTELLIVTLYLFKSNPTPHPPPTQAFYYFYTTTPKQILHGQKLCLYIKLLHHKI